jgi:hypothetical protein
MRMRLLIAGLLFVAVAWGAVSGFLLHLDPALGGVLGLIIGCVYMTWAGARI